MTCGFGFLEYSRRDKFRINLLDILRISKNTYFVNAVGVSNKWINRELKDIGETFLDTAYAFYDSEGEEREMLWALTEELKQDFLEC